MSLQNPPFVVTLLAAAVLFPGFQDEPRTDARLPVPDPSAQKEAQKTIREIFKEEYAKRSPGDRIALAKKLVDQARQTADDSAIRFMLFMEAKDAALEGEDRDLSLKIIEEVGKLYVIESARMKAAVLASTAKRAKTPEELRSVALAHMDLADEAAGEDDYESAAKLAESATNFAKQAKDYPLLVARAESKKREIYDRRAKWSFSKKAKENLASSPDLPEAHLAVGRYECLYQGRWEVGLPHLAKGSDPALKALAERDGTAPSDPAGQVAVGDGWWDLAEKERDKGLVKLNLRARARTWYEKALAGLTGLGKSRIEKRLVDLRFDRFGGTWTDITDPSRFGQPGKAGDSMTVTAESGKFKFLIMDRLPAGEYDGVSVRLTFGPAGGKGCGGLHFEPRRCQAYVNTSQNTFRIIRWGQGSWDELHKSALPRKEEHVVTALIEGGEYVIYLDYMEMGRVKATVSRLLGIGLEVGLETVIFDQLRVRRKE